MDDVRGALAANLAELRKEENLTQAEFAAQFNYSDKAVSKWERGDSLPDVVMLKTIADLYGMRVDDLLTDGGVAAARAEAAESSGEKQHDAYLMPKVLIAAMWVTMVWVVAVVVFLYSQFSIGKMYWMAFVWAVPVSFAVAFLFSRHWEGESTLQCVFASLFVWEHDHRALLSIPRIQHLGSVLRRRSGADRALPRAPALPCRRTLAAPAERLGKFLLDGRRRTCYTPS